MAATEIGPTEMGFPAASRARVPLPGNAPSAPPVKTYSMVSNFSSGDRVGPTGLSLYGGSFYGAASGFGNGLVFKFTK
jgi:hypothetical protein